MLCSAAIPITVSVHYPMPLKDKLLALVLYLLLAAAGFGGTLLLGGADPDFRDGAWVEMKIHQQPRDRRY